MVTNRIEISNFKDNALYRIIYLFESYFIGGTVWYHEESTGLANKATFGCGNPLV